jgi:hypothetical protein
MEITEDSENGQSDFCRASAGAAVSDRVRISPSAV